MAKEAVVRALEAEKKRLDRKRERLMKKIDRYASLGSDMVQLINEFNACKDGNKKVELAKEMMGINKFREEYSCDNWIKDMDKVSVMDQEIRALENALHFAKGGY